MLNVVGRFLRRLNILIFWKFDFLGRGRKFIILCSMFFDLLCVVFLKKCSNHPIGRVGYQIFVTNILSFVRTEKSALHHLINFHEIFEQILTKCTKSDRFWRFWTKFCKKSSDFFLQNRQSARASGRRARQEAASDDRKPFSKKNEKWKNEQMNEN